MSVREPGVIVVKRIQFEANHGASADERRRTRRFEIDLEVRAPAAIARAGRSDRLPDTVDYVGLCTLAIRAATAETCNLLETVATRVLDAIATRHPEVEVTIEVRKLDPPCPGTPSYCAVRLTRGPHA